MKIGKRYSLGQSPKVAADAVDTMKATLAKGDTTSALIDEMIKIWK